MARNKGVQTGGMHGPLRTPMAGPGLALLKGPVPPIAANTTVPGTAPKSAPIRSPLQGQSFKDWKSK